MPKWTLTKWIIAINCMIAAWSLALGPDSADNWIKTYLPLTLSGLGSGEWWRVLTTSWIHDDLIGVHSLHLFLNMMSLAALGQIVEGSLGRKHFCLIYFPAGLLAVVFYLVEMAIRIKVFKQTDYLQGTLLGASGCVVGLASAFAVMHPNRSIMILPWPFPVKAFNAVLVFCVLSLLLIFVPNFGIAHSAHLGGAVWGFLYMNMMGWYRKSIPTIPEDAFDHWDELTAESVMLEALSKEQVQKELPDIQRKIQLLGLERLTRRERAFLQKARSLSLI